VAFHAYVSDLKNDPDGSYGCSTRQCLENLHTFLSAFPYLIGSKARQPAQILGKFPSYYGLGPLSEFPLEDHTFYWRVKGLRGPVLCTTFPYGHDDDEEDRAEMARYAEAHGFVVEIAPPDLPDLWYPGGGTIPIAWSKRGVDWRTLGRKGAE
jgi:hypothetical protein